jgi:DNA processing protein
MTPRDESAATVALLRAPRRAPRHYADLIEEAGSPSAVLEQEYGLLAKQELAAARDEVARWEARGITLLGVLDPGYPENLRGVHDRPPLIFVNGALESSDARSIAVIGARNASSDGLKAARGISAHLVDSDYTVVSGLATGIDAAAHTAALDRGGRTIAMLATGLGRCYPPQHTGLQDAITEHGTVISQFWPDAPPRRETFRMRNAVMSGVSLATVVVEASPTSGARLQARLALAHGRPVFLLEPLLRQQWARDLAARGGTYVVDSPSQITDTVEQLMEDAPLRM